MGQQLNIYTTSNLPLSGLVNYWPFSGSTKDIFGGMDITIQNNGQLCTDRFSQSNSAIQLTNGFGNIPSGSYFDPTTGFTVMSWVYLNEPSNYGRLGNIYIFFN